MKKLLFLSLLLAATYYIYINYYQTRVLDTGGYSLSTVESNPIPIKYLINLMHQKALDMCSESTQAFNLSTSKCIENINSKIDTCRESASKNTPAIIDSNHQAKRVAKNYLNCVVPGVYCNGIEVKSEAEAREKCR